MSSLWCREQTLLGGACPAKGQATASGAECLQPLSAAGKKLNGLPVTVKLFQAFRLASQKSNIRSQITPTKSAGKFPSQEASFFRGEQRRHSSRALDTMRPPPNKTGLEQTQLIYLSTSQQRNAAAKKQKEKHLDD